MSAIFKREFQSYFSSMIGYIFVAFITAFSGLYFMIYNLFVGYSSYAFAIVNLATIFVFAVPILTMRSFAEDRKQKTDQMLLTYPVSVPSIVFGKYFSIMAVTAIPLVISCICPIIITILGEGKLLTDYCTIFALFCMASMFVSIGMFISSLTENQIVAAIVSLVVLFFIYMIDAIAGYIPQTDIASLIGFIVVIALIAIAVRCSTKNNGLTIIIAVICIAILALVYAFTPNTFAGSFNSVLSTFSIMGVLENFAMYSVFDFKGIFFFLSMSAMFLILTIQSIQRRRWN